MRRLHRQNAFTLVELMISIGIALMLIVGVNTVFKVTAQTVTAGNSLLTANRDARTVFQTFLADLNNIDAVPLAGSTTGDAPFFIIRSEHEFAFRNAADQQGATNSSAPYIQSGMFGGAPFPVVLPNFRSHRIDRLGFFTRGVFARQTTSNGVQFVSTTAGNEAYITFGHSQQPNLAWIRNGSSGTGAVWCDPGAANPGNGGKNDNNYFASDWMLSRLATVLIPTPSDGNYRADGGGLSPLALGTGTTSVGIPVTTDLAATSIAAYSSTACNASGLIRANGIQSYSYYLSGLTPAGPGPNYHSTSLPNWWDAMLNYRLQASPFVLTTTSLASGTSSSKITPSTLANCFPDLIRGCSTFIVEYSGNYYTKNLSTNDGTASSTLNDGSGAPQTVPTPDATGQVDFMLVNGVRQTRWYGYPRSTSGTAGTVNTTTGDVVPLRDVLASLNSAWAPSTTPAQNYADAERFSSTFPAAGSNYWTSLSAGADYANHYVYAAAWGPDVRNQAFPKMIRIVIEIDDHEGALKAPQRYEFIFDVQQ